jgi:hypothetical protein
MQAQNGKKPKQKRNKMSNATSTTKLEVNACGLEG